MCKLDLSVSVSALSRSVGKQCLQEKQPCGFREDAHVWTSLLENLLLLLLKCFLMQYFIWVQLRDSGNPEKLPYTRDSHNEENVLFAFWSPRFPKIYSVKRWGLHFKLRKLNIGFYWFLNEARSQSPNSTQCSLRCVHAWELCEDTLPLCVCTTSDLHRAQP